MQQPTHHRLHLRDAHDAHVVFEAVSRRGLPPITRRLNESERRDLVRSGAVFVWFEAEDDSGLMRWTDGRSWGQSRMREPYLFYDEKTPYDAARAANEMTRGPAYRFIDGAPRSGPSSSAISHQDRTAYHHSGLVKQAYSAWVTLPDSRVQKWHITAYFTYADLPNLPTIDHYPRLRELIVPTGRYRSSHSRTRGEHDKDDFSVAHPPHGAHIAHGSHGPHPAHGSHSPYGPHPPHGVHPSHGPHPSHGAYPAHGAHTPHSAHAAHAAHGAHAPHGDRVLHGDTNPYATLPPLAALAACAPPASPSRPPPLPHGARLPEDQRMIHMLNSRHVR